MEMEAIEIEQHKLIVEKCNELLKVSLNNDINYLKNIIDKSKKIIDKYNNTKLIVTDVSKTECGMWRSTIKKVIYGKFYNPIINKTGKYYNKEEDYSYLCEEHKEFFIDEYGEEDWTYSVDKLCKSCKKEYFKREKESLDFYKNQQTIKEDFKDACEQTTFCNDLKLKYILLNRRVKHKYKVEPLLLSIKETIHTEILKTFQEQNEKLITKYI